MNFADTYDFSVDLVLQMLGTPASTYYDWRKAHRQPSRRAPGRRAAAADRWHSR